jgi:hypothetical protein
MVLKESSDFPTMLTQEIIDRVEMAEKEINLGKTFISRRSFKTILKVLINSSLFQIEWTKLVLKDLRKIYKYHSIIIFLAFFKQTIHCYIMG